MRAGNADTFEDLDHLWCVAPPARRDQEGHRPAPALTREVDLAGQAAPGPAESFVGAVVPGVVLYRDAWLLLSGAGRVLMGAAGCRVDADHGPVDPAPAVGVGLDGAQVSPGLSSPAPRGLRPTEPRPQRLPQPEAWRRCDAPLRRPRGGYDLLRAPRRPALPEHLVRLMGLRSPAVRRIGVRALSIGLVDRTETWERFFMASQSVPSCRCRPCTVQTDSTAASSSTARRRPVFHITVDRRARRSGCWARYGTYGNCPCSADGEVGVGRA